MHGEAETGEMSDLHFFLTRTDRNAMESGGIAIQEQGSVGASEALLGPVADPSTAERSFQQY